MSATGVAVEKPTAVGVARDGVVLGATINPKGGYRIVSRTLVELDVSKEEGNES